MKQRQFRVGAAGIVVLVNVAGLWGCAASGQQAPLPASLRSSSAPIAVPQSSLPFPETLTMYPPLERGPAAPEAVYPIPHSVGLQQAILRSALNAGRKARQLATGQTSWDPVAFAPFVFCWPTTDEGDLLPVEITGEEPHWLARWSATEPPLKVLRESNPRILQESQKPKVQTAAELANPADVAGTDDGARYRRWQAVLRAGSQRLPLESARRLQALTQLDQVLSSIVFTTGTFPRSVNDLRDAGVALVNLIPTEDTTTADLVLEWDGEQAYGFSVRLDEGERFERVSFHVSLGLDPNLALAEPFGESGARSQTLATMRPVPRFLFDRHAGRSMTLIGAWNLVPAEQATLPITGD